MWPGVQQPAAFTRHCPSFCTTHSDGQETSNYREESQNVRSRDIVHRFVRTNDDNDDVLKHNISQYLFFKNLRFTNYLNLLLGTKIDTPDIKINLLHMRK